MAAAIKHQQITLQRHKTTKEAAKVGRERNRVAHQRKLLSEAAAATARGGYCTEIQAIKLKIPQIGENQANFVDQNKFDPTFPSALPTPEPESKQAPINSDEMATTGDLQGW